MEVNSGILIFCGVIIFIVLLFILIFCWFKKRSKFESKRQQMLEKKVLPGNNQDGPFNNNLPVLAVLSIDDGMGVSSKSIIRKPVSYATLSDPELSVSVVTPPETSEHVKESSDSSLKQTLVQPSPSGNYASHLEEANNITESNKDINTNHISVDGLVDDVYPNKSGEKIVISGQPESSKIVESLEQLILQRRSVRNYIRFKRFNNKNTNSSYALLPKSNNGRKLFSNANLSDPGVSVSVVTPPETSKHVKESFV
jgi:hypothetical protein